MIELFSLAPGTLQRSRPFFCGNQVDGMFMCNLFRVKQ
jgi:hypothetical protein